MVGNELNNVIDAQDDWMTAVRNSMLPIDMVTYFSEAPSDNVRGMLPLVLVLLFWFGEDRECIVLFWSTSTPISLIWGTWTLSGHLQPNEEQGTGAAGGSSWCSDFEQKAQLGIGVLGVMYMVGGCVRRAWLCGLDGDQEQLGWLWEDIIFFEGTAGIEGGIGGMSCFCRGKGGNFALPVSEWIDKFWWRNGLCTIVV